MENIVRVWRYVLSEIAVFIALIVLQDAPQSRSHSCCRAEKNLSRKARLVKRSLAEFAVSQSERKWCSVLRSRSQSMYISLSVALSPYLLVL